MKPGPKLTTTQRQELLRKRVLRNASACGILRGAREIPCPVGPQKRALSQLFKTRLFAAQAIGLKFALAKGHRTRGGAGMNLFDYAATLPEPTPQRAFDGKTYEPEQDHDRLKGQLWRVFQLMSDGKYRTLGEIAEEAGGSITGVSARLRDLRKPKYGEREVESKRFAGGLWRYRLVPMKNTALIG